MATILLSIPISSFDKDRALDSWKWLGLDSLTPIMMTPFGDWIMGHEDGTIHFLDTIEGRIFKIANSDSEFNELKESAEKKDEWFLEGFVLSMANRSVFLIKGKCFGFEKPPILGGVFDTQNIKLREIVPYQSFLGQLHENIQNRSGDGTITSLNYTE